ncbi:MAG: hypothetical protein Q8L98_08160 [Chlamydiales bacterium]|nr:hypothetical protein [Chlamydiales bacterium]
MASITTKPAAFDGGSRSHSNHYFRASNTKGSSAASAGLSNAVIPCHIGYAMGGVIHNGEFELPYLNGRLKDLYKQLKDFEDRQQELRASANHHNSRAIQKEILFNYQQKEEIHQTIGKVITEIEKWQAGRNLSGRFEQPMLPIDYSRSPEKQENRAALSELVDMVYIKKESQKTQLKELKKILTSVPYFGGLIDEINQIIRTTTTELQYEDREVCILYSYITLCKVRTLDPIILRKNSLGEDLKSAARSGDYSVIAQTVLGGAFIGFSSRITTIASDEKGHGDISSVARFYFAAQGGIPGSPTKDLWDMYKKWKISMEKPDSGFPLAYKLRKLEDVLKENHLDFCENLPSNSVPEENL